MSSYQQGGRPAPTHAYTSIEMRMPSPHDVTVQAPRASAGGEDAEMLATPVGRRLALGGAGALGLLALVSLSGNTAPALESSSPAVRVERPASMLSL